MPGEVIPGEERPGEERPGDMGYCAYCCVTGM